MGRPIFDCHPAERLTAFLAVSHSRAEGCSEVLVISNPAIEATFWLT
jgi:hypothetical protein